MDKHRSFAYLPSTPLSGLVLLPKVVEPSRSESTRGSARLAKSDECGPAVVCAAEPASPELVGPEPANPEADGSAGSGLSSL